MVDAMALYSISEAISNTLVLGIGVKKNASEAIKWCSRAATVSDERGACSSLKYTVLPSAHGGRQITWYGDGLL